MSTPLLLSALVVPLLLATEAPNSTPPEDPIHQAALDYVDGYYSGDADRVERGVHPSLQKVTVQRAPWGTDLLTGMDRQTLVEFARLGGEKKAEAERKIEVEVLATSGNTATVRIDSAEFLDYAHVAKINDQWRIINVLWIPHGPAAPAAPTAEDRAAIEQAGLDYVDGFYAGADERVARARHPRLQKVIVTKLPSGREFFRYTTTDGLIDYTRTGQGKLPEAERNVVVTIHHVHGNIATIEIDSVGFNDYAHVAKLGDEWKIVNVLWRPNEKK